MSWRTVVVTERCKLDLKMGYLVVRAENVRRIFLEEIAILIIENPAVSITGLLLEALVEKRVKVIFCDSRRSPLAELVPYYGSHDDSKRIGKQISWDKELQGFVWTRIIAFKLEKQAEFLTELKLSREAALIESYIPQLELFDRTNREGHAAKVYFNALFGMSFTRSGDNPINSCLDYGYGLILSAFNREIAACGYLTQLGLKHKNQFNHFNLSSDLMEPYRILVDREVHSLKPEKFGKEEKYALIKLLESEVEIESSVQTVLNSIKIYLRGVFDALNDNEPSELSVYYLL